MCGVAVVGGCGSVAVSVRVVIGGADCVVVVAKRQQKRGILKIQNAYQKSTMFFFVCFFHQKKCQNL